MKLFSVIEVNLEAARRYVDALPRIYTRRQRAALHKLYDLFEAGKWPECLEHIRDKTAFPQSRRGYPETDHINQEVADVLQDLSCNAYCTQAELLRQAKEKLSDEEILAECARRGLRTPLLPIDQQARDLIRDAAQRLRERDQGPDESPAPRDERGARSFEAAMERPADYEKLPMGRQWEIDSDLGILDWDGACGHTGKATMCVPCLVRFAARFKPEGVRPE